MLQFGTIPLEGDEVFDPVGVSTEIQSLLRHIHYGDYGTREKRELYGGEPDGTRSDNQNVLPLFRSAPVRGMATDGESLDQRQLLVA